MNREQHSRVSIRMRIRRFSGGTVMLFAIALAPSSLANPGWAQAVEAGQATSSAETFPDALEVGSRARALADSAAAAEQRIAQLVDVQALRGDVEQASRRQEELAQLSLTVLHVEYTRPERISWVRDRAGQEALRLDALEERVANRLEELGRVRGAWSDRRVYWSAWRAQLAGTPDDALVAPEFRAALARTDDVLAAVSVAIPEVVEVQREIEQLRARTARLIERIAQIRAARWEALLRRGEPVLLGPAFLAQLAGPEVREWRPLELVRGTAHRAFLRENASSLALHLVLIVVLALLARRLRRVSAPEGGWSGLLLHPWASAVFASSALMTRQYAMPPPLWDVVIWTALATSGAILAGRLIRRRSLRRGAYMIAAVYPAFLFVEAIQVPAPWFRIGLVSTALIGLVLCGVLLLRERRDPTEPWARWALQLVALLWMVLLFTEVVGFYLLGRWILHATVASGFIAFLVGFLIVLARGAIGTLVRVESTGRFRFLRVIAVPLVERVLVLLQVVLVIGAVLAVLDIWEIAPSPLDTWRTVSAIGFQLGGISITLGRVLIAALMVYLAVVGSWFFRTFALSEVYPRWEMERGVSDSINALLHYVLITLGILIALGVLGVQLQNFAIIAGALGVGIGFGLQNIVNNFVSGLILLFERPVRVGDTVVIDGEWGTIRKIGLRSTTVLTFDQSELIVPNADLVSEKVTNWTLSNPIARLIVPVGVAYGSDVSRVLELLRESAGAHTAVLPEPAPMALFVGFGDSSLDFELRIWVQELRMRLEVQSALLAEIDRRFRTEGIEIPFPQRDLHVRSIDPAIVHAARSSPVGSDTGAG
jgi:potassium-dependent mechanosensitive channel